jgi:diguanylate cyclase (GGDEF)-like protein/PAS domain S-box-containing protein
VNFRSIKTKVTLVATGTFVVLLALVSVLQAFQVKRDMSEVLGNAQFAFVSSVADEIDGKLTTLQQALIVAGRALSPSVATDQKKLETFLENQPALQELFNGLSVLNRDGRVLVDLPEIGIRGRSAGEREYFRRTVKNRIPVISEPFVGTVIRQPVVVLTAPILDASGEVVAVLAGTLNLLRPNFLGEIGQRNVGKTGDFALFGRNRTIIFSRDRSRIMAQGPVPGASPTFDHAVSGREGWEEGSNSRGLQAMISYAQLNTVPWVLMSALPIEEAYAPIAAAQTRIVAISALLALVLAPIVWLAIGRMTRPLLTLRDAIRRVRDDPGVVPEVPVRGNDEIGELAADFNALVRERVEASKALRESSHRLSMITDHIPALISYVDAEERYRYANATYREWFGVTPASVEGRTVREILGEEAYAPRASHIKEALAGKEVMFELPVIHSGSKRYTQVRYVPEVSDDGSAVGFYILASDISGLKRTEGMLRESEQQLSLALESSQLALFDWNVDTGEVFLSEQWAVILGGKPEPTRTTFAALEALVHPDDRAAIGCLVRDALVGASPHYRAEHRVRTNDGRWIWIQSNGQVTGRDVNGRALRFVGTNADITERKRAEEELMESRAELERAARHDSLTGLPNRRMFVDRLDQALARARRSGQWMALLCLDVDRFKAINDTMGHAAGDALLVALAERLNGCIRESDTVARLGGDEFVILLQDMGHPGDAEFIARKIIEAMRREFQVESRRFHSTTSIGIACTRGESSPQDLLKQADAALYQAKEAGRNRFCLASATGEEPAVASPKRAG